MMCGGGGGEIVRDKLEETVRVHMEEMLNISNLLYSGEEPFILNKNKSSTAGCFRLNQI